VKPLPKDKVDTRKESRDNEAHKNRKNEAPHKKPEGDSVMEWGNWPSYKQFHTGGGPDVSGKETTPQTVDLKHWEKRLGARSQKDSHWGGLPSKSTQELKGQGDRGHQGLSSHWAPASPQAGTRRGVCDSSRQYRQVESKRAPDQGGDRGKGEQRKDQEIEIRGH